jgi:ABC-2 type transport system ATP-binding protein
VAERNSKVSMNALNVSQLVKTYANGVSALQGIDLSVEQGDFFALLGPNGAGKSTLIGIITSLINKTSGSVSVFGHDIERDPVSLKRCLGLVPQEFNFNVFEPVEEILVNQAGFYGIGRKQAFKKAEGILKQLDLWGKRREMARTLSGGMKRRMMIGRALMHTPKLLILDEPTAGVDLEIRQSMWEFLGEINRQGTTIILTTHYLEEAERLCRHIAIIDEGRIVEHTDMKSLLNQVNVENFVLHLKQSLQECPSLPCLQWQQVDECTLEVTVERNQGLSGIFSCLSAVGVEVLSMQNKNNRLETLFMGLMADKKSLATTSL